MKEVRKGMFRFDGEIKEPSGRPRVIVHPWYEKGRSNAYPLWAGSTVIPVGKCRAEYCYDGLVKLDSFKLTSNYLHNLRAFLECSVNTNIMVFEESEIAEETARKIADIRGSRGIYVVPTEPNYPSPRGDNKRKTRLKGIIDFLSSWSSPLFAGSLISMNYSPSNRPRDKWRWGRCLGTLFQNCYDAGIRGNLVLGCCVLARDGNALDFKKTLEANIIPEISDQQT